jgi:hypothetical protein
MRNACLNKAAYPTEETLFVVEIRFLHISPSINVRVQNDSVIVQTDTQSYRSHRLT